MSRRAYPPRRTEEERRITHEALYGKGATLPARQFRFAPGQVSWPSWRKTEEERKLTHQTIYGKEVALPERQFRYAPWGRYPSQSLTNNTDWTSLLIIGGGLFLIWLLGRKG